MSTPRRSDMPQLRALRSFPLIALSLVLGSLALGAAPSRSHPRAETPVVSYLISVGPDTTVDVPDEGDRFHVSPQRWQWRLFDPARGQDTLSRSFHSSRSS